MRYIHELREGEMVSEVYLCKNKITGKTKSGKSYYSLQLVDASGTMDGKIWELNSGIGHFESMNYVKVDGQVTSFNNTLQLTIKKIRIAEEGEYDINDYMPCTKKNVDEMFDKLLGIIATIEKPYYKKLLESFFVSLSDTHNFTNGTHLCSKFVFNTFEFLKCPACKLDNNIITVWYIFI